MKLSFFLFGREYAIKFLTRKKRTVPIVGVTNRTKDGYYCVFLDYDDIPMDWVIGELKSIQEEFKLSNFYIFQSSKNGIHAVTFDKLTLDEYKAVLRRSSCDERYKKVPYVWGKGVHTLRVSNKNGNKIVHTWTLETNNNMLLREKSCAHANFFKAHYGLKLPDDKYDEYQKLIMAKYMV